MIEKQKAKAAAEALMSERRASQTPASARRPSAQEQKVLQRRAAVLGLVGAACGALAGYYVWDQWLLASCAGFTLGIVIATTWSTSTRGSARLRDR